MESGTSPLATWRCHEIRRSRTTRDSRRICVPTMPEKEKTSLVSLQRGSARGWEGAANRACRLFPNEGFGQIRVMVDPFLNQLWSLAWLSDFFFFKRKRAILSLSFPCRVNISQVCGLTF